MNGQIVSFTQTASDAAAARQTVTGYFQVLCDTLLGVMLPSWQPRAKVREVAHPKFHFFDPQRGKKAVAFEVKSGHDWRPAFSKSLKNLCASAKIVSAYGIYDGDHERLDGPVRVFPVRKFLKELWAGSVIS